MYYKVSKKEMYQLTLNTAKKILKRKKSISDLVMALPERVVVGLSTSSSSSINARITRFVSITRVNAIIFILLITAAFTSTVVVFITIVVITV